MLSTGFGGAERHVLDLGVALSKAECSVQLICRPAFYENQQARLAHFEDVTTVEALNNWDLIAVWEIRQALTKFRSQLVHAHLSRATRLGSFAARLTGLPMLCTTHNLIKPKYFRRVKHFVATSRQQVGHLSAANVPVAGIRFIPNFSLFSTNVESESQGPGNPVFVAYGRFVRKKGFDLLIEAMAALLNKHPDARLVLGGEGADEQLLKDRASALGIEQQVEFAGWVDDVEALLEQGTAFVLPSRDEPFGIVLLEAMSKGVPIVTTRAAGPCEVLDESTAWFADLGDSGSLAEAMHQCLAAPTERAEKAKRAQKHYEAEYHVDQVVPKIIAYYRDLIPQAAC